MERYRCYGCMNMVEDPICPYCGHPADGQNAPGQLVAGTVIGGGYLVGRAVGSDAAGLIYVGLDQGRDVPVLIRCYSDPEAGRKEAALLIQSKELAQVSGAVDAFEEGGDVFLILDQVRGPAFGAYIQRRGGALVPDEALRILRGLIGAVAVLHQNGLAHGSICLERIVLDPMGGARLLGFGEVTGAQPVEDVLALSQLICGCIGPGLAPDQIPGLTEQQQMVLKMGLEPDPAARFNSAVALRRALLGEVTTPIGPLAQLRQVEQPQPAVEEAPQIPVIPVVIPEPVAEEAPFVAPEPVVEEAPFVAPEPVVEEAPFVAPEPVVEEAPFVAPEPVVEEAPFVAPEPVVEEAPFVAPEPVAEETPFVIPVPVVEEAPFVAPEPVVEETPVAAAAFVPEAPAFAQWPEAKEQATPAPSRMPATEIISEFKVRIPDAAVPVQEPVQPEPEPQPEPQPQWEPQPEPQWEQPQWEPQPQPQWEQPQWQPQPQWEQPPKKKKTGLIIGIVAGVAVLLIALAVCFFTVHIWKDATCEAPKTCAICGKTQGGIQDHDWEEATCDAPETCAYCGETRGEALGHDWIPATCEVARTCKLCGATEGHPMPHIWKEANCEEPKTCATCGMTEGEVGGHAWVEATCTSPKTCAICGKTEGSALGHSWKNATYTEPKTCSRCGMTEGQPKGYISAVDGEFQRFVWGNSTTSSYEFYEQVDNCISLNLYFEPTFNYGAWVDDWKLLYKDGSGQWHEYKEFTLNTRSYEHTFSFSPSIDIRAIAVIPRIPGNYSYSFSLGVWDVHYTD